MQLSPEQIEHYREQGYLIVRGVFDAAEAKSLRDHYMKVRAEGPKPGDMGGDPRVATDPLNKYPRMINMHNWDDLTARWAADERLRNITRQLIDDEPVLNQTMIYFKPPQARGQSLHQDQQYITIDPLIGVWVALDRSDETTGQMVLYPGSHKLGMQEVEEADMNVSFTMGQTKVPAQLKEFGADMEAGDVLFFDGKTIHGSHPNTTTDRWRRSFICHYVGEHAVKFKPGRGEHMKDVHPDADHAPDKTVAKRA